MSRTIPFALALFGLFVSLYLLWVYTSPAHPMVCLGTGCDAVRTSQFAHLLLIPVPAYGVAYYGILSALLFAEPFAGTFLLRRLILALSVIGALVAGGLTAIEAFVIHAWCVWCIAQAVAVAGILLLRLRRRRVSTNSEGHATGRAHVAALMLSLVAGIPSFVWLTNRGVVEEVPPPPTAAQIAERLVRPDSHVAGNPHALVTFVEFGDLQCPVCAANYPEVRRLQQEFGSRVRFVFRHFPLPQMHPYAIRSAEAAECAAEQGKFWEMIDRIYDAKGDLKDSSLERFAGDIGLDLNRYRGCLQQGHSAAVVRRDGEDGRLLGVRHTPTYFIGSRRIVGALPFGHLAALINDVLRVASTPDHTVATARDRSHK